MDRTLGERLAMIDMDQASNYVKSLMTSHPSHYSDKVQDRFCELCKETGKDVNLVLWKARISIKIDKAYD